MRDFGTVRPGTTLYVPFATYDSNDPTASVTTTGLAVTDIEIYKDGGTTQRASDAGYTLLDTDGIDFDGLTGIHGFSINLADNTTAGFYAAGSQYWVVVSSITVDAGTISFIAATFQIGYPDAILNTTIATLASQTSFTLTAGPADNNALVGCVVLIHDVASAVQMAIGVVSAYTGSTKTVTLGADPGIFTAVATDNVSFYIPVNTRWLSGTALTGRDIGASVLLSPGTGTGQVSLTSGAVTAGTVSDKTGYSLTATTGLGNQTSNITGNLSGSVGSVTGAVGSVTAAVTLPTIPSNWITAAGINAAAMNGKGDWNVGKTGYSLTATTGLGNQTSNITGNLSGSVGSVTGLTAANLDVAVSTRMAAYTQPTGFLAATFPVTVASTTNITAGTITTVTNLTNAPTAGDLTAVMKSSVNAEVVDALATDTYAEPGQATPAATASLSTKIGYLYKAWRNKSTQTATTYSLFNDDTTTVGQKSTVSDDGTTFTRDEIATGP